MTPTEREHALKVAERLDRELKWFSTNDPMASKPSVLDAGYSATASIRALVEKNEALERERNQARREHEKSMATYAPTAMQAYVGNALVDASLVHLTARAEAAEEAATRAEAQLSTLTAERDEAHFAFAILSECARRGELAADYLARTSGFWQRQHVDLTDKLNHAVAALRRIRDASPAQTNSATAHQQWTWASAVSWTCLDDIEEDGLGALSPSSNQGSE